MPSDLLIVGGGISGLHLAYLLCNRPEHRYNITLIEKEQGLGGRIFTNKFEKNGIHYSYEAGAGRINEIHKTTLNLIRKMGLGDQLFKIPRESSAKRDGFVKGEYVENVHNAPAKIRELYDIHSDFKGRLTFDRVIDRIYKSSKRDRNVHNQTLHEYISKKFGLNVANYMKCVNGYDAEFDTNAPVSIHEYHRDLNVNNDFYVLSGGLSGLVRRLREFVESRGVRVNTGTQMVALRDGRSGGYIVETETIANGAAERHAKRYDNVVLCMNNTGLRQIDYIRETPFIMNRLDYLRPVPLCRIYAGFPVRNGKSWFSGLPNLVTDLSLRHIIPYKEKLGLIMIGYMDGELARYWHDFHKKDHRGMVAEIMRQVREIYAGKIHTRIPDPYWVNVEYWEEGGSSCAPGIHWNRASRELMNPKRGLFLGGEVVSTSHFWVEGAMKNNRKISAILNK